MDAKILQIILRAKDEATKTINSVNKTVEQSTRTIDKMTGTMKVAGAAMVAVGTTTGIAIYNMSKSGAKLYDLEKSFESLSKNAGYSMDTLLSELQTATAGTIDNASLIENSVRAAMLGLPIEKMSGLFKIARQQSVAMGEDMGYMLDSIVKGIGRASPMILDNLGITISLGEVYEDAAKKLGKKTEELTKAEQQQALTNAVLDWGARKEKELGGVVSSNTDSYARMNTAIVNLKNNMSKLYYDTLAPFVEKISNFVEKLNQVDPQLLKFIAGVTALSSVAFIVLGAFTLFVGLAPAIVGVFSAVAVGAGTAVLILGGVIVAIVAVIAAIVAWKQNTFGFRDKVIGAFEKVKSSISSAIDWIKDKIEEWKVAVKDFLDETETKIKNFPDNVKSAFLRWVADTKESMIAWYSSIYESVETFIKSIPERVKIGLESIFWAMVEYDIKTLAKWQEGLSNIEESVRVWFEMLPSKFQQWLANVWLAMVLWFDSVYTGIVDKLTLWYDAIRIWFEMLPSRVESWLINTWLAMLQWWDDTRENIITKLGEWETSIQTWFEALPGKFTNWLGNIWKSIEDWFKNFGENFKSWWKSLGEESPNKLFEGWKNSEPTMAGKIVAGIIAFIGVVLVTLVIGLLDVGGRAVIALFDGMKWAFDAGKSAIYNKVNEIGEQISKIFSDLKDKVTETISNMVSTISDLLFSIKIPKFKVEFDTKSIGGFDVKVPSIKMYQFGGVVPNSGLAYLHSGEFVMSRGMVEGRRAMPPSVNNNYDQPISINFYGDQNVNGGQLAYTLAWHLRNTR